MIKCKQCATELEESAKFCTNCGKKVSNEIIEEKDIEKYKGLGGWLILIGIGVTLSPLRLIAEVSNVYLPIFKNGIWDAINTPNSESYNILLSYLLSGEIIFNSLMILASFYLIYLFFAKKSLFPKVYIGIIVVTFIFILLDAILVSSVLPGVEIFKNDTLQALGKTLLVGLIWIPYMLVSKRVKATFVK